MQARVPALLPALELQLHPPTHGFTHPRALRLCVHGPAAVGRAALAAVGARRCRQAKVLELIVVGELLPRQDVAQGEDAHPHLQQQQQQQ